MFLRGVNISHAISGENRSKSRNVDPKVGEGDLKAQRVDEGRRRTRARKGLHRRGDSVDPLRRLQLPREVAHLLRLKKDVIREVEDDGRRGVWSTKSFRTNRT